LLRKEIYINRLARTYTKIFDCDDMAAINNMRANYSASELKEILQELDEEPNLSYFEIHMLFKPHQTYIAKKKGTKTLPLFILAGIVGSFKVVSEKGWLYLIPFWIIIVILSKICDWAISKWN